METPVDWDGLRDTYARFWRGEKLGRPLLHLWARRDEPPDRPPAPPPYSDPEDKYLDPEYVVAFGRRLIAEARYMADAFPVIQVDMGPMSLAGYLGGRPTFSDRTVWFLPPESGVADDLVCSDDDPWWQRHLAVIEFAARTGAAEGFLVPIPDLGEGVDILSALMGGEEMVTAMVDEPDRVHRLLDRIDAAFPHYYGRIRQLVADRRDWSASRYLRLWGPGRTRQLQCDAAALMNPALFREFALPSLARHAAAMDNVVYHLDGSGAIYTAPMIAGLAKVRAVQWMPGQGAPPPWDSRWDAKVFDPLVGAAKPVQIHIHTSADSGDAAGALAGCDRLVRRYGPDALWFVWYCDGPEAIAERIADHARRNWNTRPTPGRGENKGR